MKFNNKGKCIQITQKEYDDIYNIYKSSTCIRLAEYRVIDYLYNKFGNCEAEAVAFNLLCAVINKYKYMKIVD